MRHGVGRGQLQRPSWQPAKQADRSRTKRATLLQQPGRRENAGKKPGNGMQGCAMTCPEHRNTASKRSSSPSASPTDVAGLTLTRHAPR
jgi:hypothetical protein